MKRIFSGAQPDVVTVYHVNLQFNIAIEIHCFIADFGLSLAYLLLAFLIRSTKANTHRSFALLAVTLANTAAEPSLASPRFSSARVEFCSSVDAS